VSRTLKPYWHLYSHPGSCAARQTSCQPSSKGQLYGDRLRRFANDVKGDALYMMELVLSLEKLNFHKLRLLHDIACKHDDAEMADFIGGHFPWLHSC
jgi:hypothetical protein